MKILLIAGHGAGDPGASGCGYKEADLTRELVNLIAPKLRKYATVDVYNVNRSAFYDVQNGTFKISKYDYVLEVHFNAFNGSGHGTEIFVTDSE
ncbi:MAG: N-acetylmuramoyl-L-alanine amidase, partial [[Clostridium] innocuum]